MREIRQSGLEGGVGFIPHPYPYPNAAAVHGVIFWRCGYS
jgi:hypothetical protein